MVMISDPAAITALYTDRADSLPPGRNVGPRAGDGHALGAAARGRGAPVAAQADAAAVPRRADARLRGGRSPRSPTREIDSWPVGEEFPIHPRMQAVTLEVILRAVFGVTDAPRLERLRSLLGDMLRQTSPRRGCSCRCSLASRFGAADPGPGSAAARGRSTSCSPRRSPSAAPTPTSPSARTSSRCWSRPASRTASGMGDAELRDQLMTLLLAGHETTATALAWTFDLLLRNPARARAPAGRDRDEGGRRVPARGRSPSRCACGRSCRSPGGGCAEELRVGGYELPAGDRHHARRSGSPTPVPSSIRIPRVPARALPRRARPRPTPGSRSAAASAAASAPRSPSSRCGSCCARCWLAASCGPVRSAPSGSPAATSPSRPARHAGGPHREAIRPAEPVPA